MKAYALRNIWENYYRRPLRGSVQRKVSETSSSCPENCGQYAAAHIKEAAEYIKILLQTKTCEYMSKCQQKDFLLEIFLSVNKPGSPGSKHGKITQKNPDACKVHGSAGGNAADHLACLRKRQYSHKISQKPRNFFC